MNNEWLRAVNDRLQWDGMWEDTCNVFTTYIESNPHPKDVYEALDDAWEFIQGPPKLLICSWTVGRLLFDRNTRDWNNTTDGKLPNDYPFHRDLDAERKFLLERGYFGRYRGALVAASVYADKEGILATVENPGDVDYDGSNCIRLIW